MPENVVICLMVGDAYTTDYVYKLQNMVRRFCTIPHDFVCYSDRIIPDIDTVLIPDSLELDPVWYKLRMLDHPSFNPYKRKVFLDLDIVIHNSIDWMFNDSVNGLHVLKSAWKPQHIVDRPFNTGCNSSVMLWNDSTEIARTFEARRNDFMCYHSGIDRFLWKEVFGQWQFIDNTEVYSFREGADENDNAQYIMRPSKSVCIYHQHPKPHEAMTHEPAKSFWK